MNISIKFSELFFKKMYVAFKSSEIIFLCSHRPVEVDRLRYTPLLFLKEWNTMLGVTNQNSAGNPGKNGIAGAENVFIKLTKHH